MNYLTEIKLFYDWLETHHLSTSGIALWHALMFIANRSGWQERFAASNSVLEIRTQMPKASLYRARKQLINAGLIEVDSQGSRQSALFKMNSLKEVLSAKGSHDEYRNKYHIETHNETQTINKSHNESQIETPPIDYTDSLKKKENKKRKKKEPFSIDQWVKTIESPWRELMLLWLEYKRVRKESYRSEIGAKSCLFRLKKLSGESPAVAQQIIETSMANNWAGLFELKRSSANRPQYGQRIGQIIQSDDEARRQRMVERLRNAGNDKPDNQQ